MKHTFRCWLKDGISGRPQPDLRVCLPGAFNIERPGGLACELAREVSRLTIGGGRGSVDPCRADDPSNSTKWSTCFNCDRPHQRFLLWARECVGEGLGTARSDAPKSFELIAVCSAANVDRRLHHALILEWWGIQASWALEQILEKLRNSRESVAHRARGALERASGLNTGLPEDRASSKRVPALRPPLSQGFALHQLAALQARWPWTSLSPLAILSTTSRPLTHTGRTPH